MMKKDIKILIIGPFPNPITGVSLANKKVKEILEKNIKYNVSYINSSYPEFDERIGEFSFKKIIFFLKLNTKVFKLFFFDKIYITPGQTFFGISKYSLFILISSILRKELIIHVHGNHLGTEYNSLRGVKKTFIKFIISKFNKGIVLSESLKKNLTPFLDEKEIFVLPNFAEEDFYIDEVDVNFNELRIIYLSNLMEEKGIIYLLDSLLELTNMNIKFKAKIAGNIDENLKENILKKFDKLTNVDYLDVVTGVEKKNLLEWGNVFVLPTYYKMEGQPISILEAMASKNVILTTKHAGIPDVVTNGINGYFVDKKSASSITEKLVYLSGDKNIILDIANRNKKYFLENYSITIFEEKILKILKI